MIKCLHLLLLLTASICFAQNNTLKMTTTLPESREVDQLLRFENIDMYHTKISGPAIKGKNYYIIAKELWKGKIKNIDTVFTSASLPIPTIQGDSLKFTVTATKSGKKTLKIQFDFGRFSLTREYKSTKHNDYSLRDFGTQLPIEIGKPFYAFAYILPQRNKDGSSSWCAVESSGRDIEKWGTEFGLEHYILFEMQFFD